MVNYSHAGQRLVCTCSVKRTVLSRAYINFSSPQDVAEFAAKFDGHTFIGARRQQYKCTVEYAPFQKVPAAGAKRAPMEGTIDKGGPRWHQLTDPKYRYSIIRDGTVQKSILYIYWDTRNSIGHCKPVHITVYSIYTV